MDVKRFVYRRPMSWEQYQAMGEEAKRALLSPQCRRVLEFLDRNGSVNPMQAMNELGIMRLAARIDDLKWFGYDFSTEITRAKNRFGEPVRYATYRRAAPWVEDI